MNPKSEKTAKAILDYLRRNPDAGDTLDGIAKWWLDRNEIETSIQSIGQALEHLVATGLIKVRTVDGRRFYQARTEN